MVEEQDELDPSYVNLLSVRHKVIDIEDHLMGISAFKERKQAYDSRSLIGDEADCFDHNSYDLGSHVQDLEYQSFL